MSQIGKNQIQDDAVDSSTVEDGTLVDADVASNAAISLTKIGSGTAATGDLLRWNGTAWEKYTRVRLDDYDATLGQTSSTTYVNYRTWVSSSVPAGKYRISWTTDWRYSQASTDILMRVQADDGTTTTTVGEVRYEPKDAGTNQVYTWCSFGFITTASAGTITLTLDFAVQDAAQTGTIYDVQFEIMDW